MDTTTTSITPLNPRRSADRHDLTARARIRDAALYCFARDGFRVPLRTIAEEAGVSVPLITHHYGTKDHLHHVCDERVLERFLDMKILAIHEPDSIKDTLADTSAASVLTVYMVRSFLDATSSAQAFFSQFVDHLRTIVAAARGAGMITESGDEEERLHLLASQAIGSLMVEFAINPPADPRDFVDQVYTSRNLAAQLEFYSRPFFTEHPAMKTYLEHVRSRGQD
ncbi:MAG: TetR family transcriptional regulator [Propionibacteriaceae bacterium]|jgi:AcrR family transcriptional regulator|nr:TetR family transcriptional regulator [Propionibacteriaceae bacterium]